MSADGRCHVIVIGGGAAGLSAALVLGRARTNVVLLDRGTPSNLAATGIGGLLGHDRYPPRAFYEECRQQLAHYPTVTTIAAGAAMVHADHDRRRVVLGDGTRLDADHLVIATGMRYDRPALDGIDEFWGASVFHCPFCHGWENRDRITVAIVHDDASVERTLLLTNWTDDLTAVAAPGFLSPEQQRLLITAGIHVETGTITALHGRDRELTAVELAEGSRLRAQALLIPAAHVPRNELVERAGIATTHNGHIVVDSDGRTSHPGVWAVGDVADSSSTVARAIAAGATAATAIIRELVAERVYGRAGSAGPK